jgi:hypothetical protein
MGSRRTMPKAFGVTFDPGAICFHALFDIGVPHRIQDVTRRKGLMLLPRPSMASLAFGLLHRSKDFLPS